MTEEEIKQLIAKYKLYGDKEDLINYSDFCDNIDSIFGEGTVPAHVIGNSKSTAVCALLNLLTAILIFRTSQRRKWR